VTLPLSHRAVDADAEPVKVAAPARGRRRVLLVDDNRDFLEMTEAILQNAGYEVATAMDGRQGIAQLVALQPDVAFVDIGLPIMDGYAVADRARAAGVRSYLVAISGYGQPEDKRRAHAAGFDLHLTKPVIGSVLLTTITDGLQRDSSQGAGHDPRRLG
jgi:CheY-like chemotaxis protein